MEYCLETKGLTKHFQRAFVKLWQLIKEEHSIVGEADFAGLGTAAATHERHL